ncbi:MAG: hypothetical protein M3279_10850 [Actinomycetota bacterium]|nr:hypothetical protein [Actinomycetota bacterium]
MRLRLRAVAALAAALLAVPAAAGAAESSGTWPVSPRCTAQMVATGPGSMSIYVTLEAVPPPIPPVPHSVACYVYVNGQLLGTVQGNHVGFVIVGAGALHNVPVGVVSLCTEWEGHPCP